MKKSWIFTGCVLFSLLTVSGFAFADDKESDHDPKNVDVDIDVTTDDVDSGSFGTITINLDGVSETVKFGDVQKQILKKLPKQVQVQIERAVNGSKKDRSEVFMWMGADGKLDSLNIDGKSGKGEFLKDLPKDVAKHVEKAMLEAKKALKEAEFAVKDVDVRLKSVGHVVVVGADGDIKEMKVIEDGEGNGFLNKLLIDEQRRISKTQRKQAKKRASKATADGGLESKLDLILRRLEQMEKDIQELKEAR